MASNNSSVLCIPLGVSKVLSGQRYIAEQWQNHFLLLEKIKAEYDSLKESGSSYRPLATPAKTGPVRKVYPARNLDELPMMDVGRVTRSMVKKTNAVVFDSTSTLEYSSRARKGKKDNRTDSEKENRLIGDAEINNKGKQRSKDDTSDVDTYTSDGTDKSKTNNKENPSCKEHAKKTITKKNDRKLDDMADWLTDDDSYKSPMTSLKCKPDKHSAKKPRKRKSSQYFTPSCPAKSCRFTRAAAARAEAQTHYSGIKKKPFATLNIGSAKNSPAKHFEPQKQPSAASTTSSATVTPVSKSSKYNRIPSDKKTLSASAQKRKEEAEKEKQKWLQMIEEKQKNALLQREAQIQQKVLKAKLKNEQEAKKSGRAKEIQREQEEKKRLKEAERKRELERRQKELEEARKVDMMKHQENLKKRQLINDQKRQEKEEEERKRLLRQEDLLKAKTEEIEHKKKMEEELRRVFHEHNKINKLSSYDHSIKQPSVAKIISNQQTILNHSKPLNGVPSTEAYVALNGTYNVDGKKGDDTVVIDKIVNDPTFAVDDPVFKIPLAQSKSEITSDKTSLSSVVNYDIANGSDENTDDEEAPRNPIPGWAKGDRFLKALEKQYSVPRKKREEVVRELFPRIELPINLSDIFTESKAVCPRYEKRTSSAVWTSPSGISMNISRLSSPNLLFSPKSNIN